MPLRRSPLVLGRDPGWNATMRTTCVATMLEGGHATNALPQRARANINSRIFPGVSAESVGQKLTAQFWPGVPVLPIPQPEATDSAFPNAAGIPIYGVVPIFARPTWATSMASTSTWACGRRWKEERSCMSSLRSMPLPLHVGQIFALPGSA
jgi:Peptidase dimerisation domain